MREGFGARLRQRREEQQIALTTIAEQTKIKVSLLEGLERDDVSHWPFGIFRRAFIRAYAHAIGLEPDTIVREFLESYPDPTEVVATLPGAHAAAEGASVGTGPPTRLRYLVDSAIGSLSRSRFRVSPVVQPRACVADDLSAPVPPALPAASADVLLAVKCTPPPPAPPAFQPDLVAAAQLCTELGQLDKAGDAAPLLEKAAGVLGAVGLIIWVWDPQTTALTPGMSHGYSDRVLAQLPAVKPDAHNATAAAFRSARACVVDGGEGTNGAIVVPLMTPTGCVGVLAVELRQAGDGAAAARAVVTIFAALLARWISVERSADASDRRLA